MHTFERYKEQLTPIINKLKSNLPDFFIVEKEVNLIQLDKGEIILDFETTGLDVSAEITCYGIVKGNKLKIVCRMKASEEELLEELKKDLEGVKRIYAYYVPFEEKYLRDRFPDWEEWGIELCELMPWEYCKLKNLISIDWGDRYDGEDCPKLWRNWVERLSFGSLAGLIHHNYADLMRELMVLFLHRNEAFGDSK
jgi:uncharacterized protein YprB with RNaseH-like and TPR domain